MANSRRKSPPFRAEQVGSLLRPAELVAASERLVAQGNAGMGPHHNTELRSIEDGLIREVIRVQEEIGLKDITDGEFRRRSWWSELFMGWEGVGVVRRSGGAIAFRTAVGSVKAESGSGAASVSEIVLEGPLRWREGTIVPAFAFLRAHTNLTPKVTIPAPSQLHYYLHGRERILPVYSDLDAFWDDVVTAYGKEIDALYTAGARYIQFDDVSIPFMCDPLHRSQIESWGEDPNDLQEVYANVINRVIKRSHSDIVFALHQCRGNRQGAWAAEGSYEPVADVLFNAINVDAYFLEYDTARAGDFRPLRYLPKHKTAVLGLVSTKVPELESADMLKHRLDEAAKFAPLECLALSPQCGFASTFRGNPVTLGDQVAKLKSVVEVARDIWGET